jgi:hypothetical protein
MNTRKRQVARRTRDGRPAGKRPAATGGKRWSHQVTDHSDALDLQPELFKSGTPQEIAQSLKKSAEHSRRRKGTAFQSAMSMLNFYINRAGRNLTKPRRAALQAARGKLRTAFGREP